MKKIYIIFFTVISFYAAAQNSFIKLKSRNFQPIKNISAFSWSEFTKKHAAIDGKYFAAIQFSKTLTVEQKLYLKNNGVELIDYIPENAFTVAITTPVGRHLLESTGAISIFNLDVADKIHPRLLQRNFPSWSVKQPNTLDVVITFSKAIAPASAKNILLKHFTLVDESWLQFNILTLRINQDDMEALASVPFIDYINPAPPQQKTLNDEARQNARANILQAPLSLGGENLTGNGVTIGIGDDADPSAHVDLQDRVINRAAFIPNNHGTHTAGIAAGAGIKDEDYKGFAPMATIVSQLFGGIYLNAAAYIADYGMVITNNSWGNITSECDYAGVYDTYSKLMDDLAFQYPYLLNVFAVGNDGLITCTPFSQGYHNVLSGHQSSKNILSVGWGDKQPLRVSPNSSFGPAADGRLKPEITATGSDVISTGAGNNYFSDWGSSMASPNVAGGAALLIEKYRQLNSGANPRSGLLKALLMNGAMDIENPHPDYKSGYGFLHLARSLDMLKNNWYAISTVATGATNNHTISVPANTAQLKVMVYWHDPSAPIFAQNSLVNDIDLEVITPTLSTVLPWKLNPNVGNVADLATRAADHFNNSEQVTIDDPLVGTYSISIKGTAINIGASQEYFVVYDFVPTGVDLSFPSSGEPLVPGETIVINWDAWGAPANTFTLEYSTDNGNNWININAAIPADAKQFNWTVPNVTTHQARIRLTKNGTAYSDVSAPFVIVGRPAVSLSSLQCEGYISINWNAIAGATDYEVMMKQGLQMIPVATTTNTSFVFNGLNKDSVYWVTVRARMNGQAGKRAIAVNRQPNNGTCAGSISDNDLKVDSIISPNTGRKFTSTEITSTNVIVRIKNLDDAPVTGFQLKYSINNSPYNTQNISTTIPAGGTYTHTFTGLSFSSVGTYNISVVVKNNTTDNITSNDTLVKVVRQLDNPPLTLSYTENFDAAPAFEVWKDTRGLPGLDKWDFVNSTAFGRVRSFVNTGIAKSGNRAITLDTWRYAESGNTNYFIGTFNLGTYTNILPDELGLALVFNYKHHGQSPHPDNRVWARAKDTDPWIEVFSFDSMNTRPGIWKSSGLIRLYNTNAKSPTASFQLRFGQHGVLQMGDDISNNGITIDDVRILALGHTDLEMLSVDTPLIHSCGLSAAVPLRVTTRGYPLPAPVPINYRVDGEAIITESFFGGIGTYTFTTPMNLSAPGPHTIEAWIQHPNPSYNDDDTIRVTIYNQPIINTFPYLESFESGAANWYAQGDNNTWEFGTPSSLKINKAANGSKAWKTTLKGQYRDNELSYLYSPCFDIASLSNPYLSFSMALDIEQCQQAICDQAWMEYSADGKNWLKLGAYGQGTNWYNRAGDNVWDSASFKRWHVASIPLPAGLNKLQLRFVFQSDAGVSREGVAIDDIHIYNNPNGIHPSSGNAITQTVSGNSWIDFVQNGKLIASIHPNNNNPGAATVQSYVHVGGFAAVRDTNYQYYLNRNITIKPTNSIQPDSTTIRIYFTDREVDTLTRATGCSDCTKPADAYELGITKYDNSDDSKENGTLLDNVGGIYTYIQRSQVKKVPFDIGYYAEFKVKDFSEFWFNNGGANGNQPLPLHLLFFSATKVNRDVQVKWTTTNEQNLDRYEIEVSRSTRDASQLQFSMIGIVQANNQAQSSYSFIDAEANKSGIRYYRIKIIDKNGGFTYSEIRSVVFDGSNEWMVYPNPVKDKLQLISVHAAGEKVSLQLSNAAGQVVHQQSFTALGNQEKNVVPLQHLARGVYWLKIVDAGATKVFKIIKD